MKYMSGMLLNEEFIVRRKVSYITRFYIYQLRNKTLTDEEFEAASYCLYMAVDKAETLSHIRHYLKYTHKEIAAGKIERTIKGILPTDFFKQMVTLKSNLKHTWRHREK